MKDNNKVRTLIDIPADGNYIEILGHRIDGFESFEAFLEHLKKYVVLEETAKAQKAEIERLQNALFKQEDTMQMIVKERDTEIDSLKMVIDAIEDHIHPLPFETDYAKAIRQAKAEAVKEFAERLKNYYTKKKIYDRPNAHTLIGFLFSLIDDIAEEMVGAESG